MDRGNNTRYSKVSLIKIIVVSVVLTVVIAAIVLGAVFLTPPSSAKVFSNSLASVVELKASSANIGESYGTAEFIKNDGTAVTNAHVVTYTSLGSVRTFDNYFIRFAFEEEYREIELVKYDVDLDIAILKITAGAPFKAIKLADSDALGFGDKVYAIGNSSNYGLSLTQGIVSMPKINIEFENKTREVIQCDLTISAGNSGGALLDKFGRLIGITTFRTKDNDGNVVYGLAYSVPINLVLEYVKSL